VKQSFPTRLSSSYPTRIFQALGSPSPTDRRWGRGRGAAGGGWVWEGEEERSQPKGRGGGAPLTRCDRKRDARGVGRSVVLGSFVAMRMTLKVQTIVSERSQADLYLRVRGFLMSGRGVWHRTARRIPPRSQALALMGLILPAEARSPENLGSPAR
jgi:hypothetical protein